MSNLLRTDCCTSICQGFIIHVATPVLPLALSMFHLSSVNSESSEGSFDINFEVSFEGLEGPSVARIDRISSLVEANAGHDG